MKAFNRLLIWLGNGLIVSGLLQVLGGSRWVAEVSILLWALVGLLFMLFGSIGVALED